MVTVCFENKPVTADGKTPAEAAKALAGRGRRHRGHQLPAQPRAHAAPHRGDAQGGLRPHRLPARGLPHPGRPARLHEPARLPPRAGAAAAQPQGDGRLRAAGEGHRASTTSARAAARWPPTCGRWRWRWASARPKPAPGASTTASRCPPTSTTSTGSAEHSDARHQDGAGPRPGSVDAARRAGSRGRCAAPRALACPLRHRDGGGLHPHGRRRAAGRRPLPAHGRRQGRAFSACCSSTCPTARRRAAADSHDLYAYFVRRGYVVARVDIRGTGNSEGRLIPHEYSRDRERRRRGRDRLALEAALLDGQGRDVRDLVGRLQLDPHGHAESPRPQGHHRGGRHRRPLPGRRPLHGRHDARGLLGDEPGPLQPAAGGARLPDRRAVLRRSLRHPALDAHLQARSSATARSGSARP